jgi:hypothetical protein
MKFCHLQVNGWNWRTSSLSKVSQIQKAKSYMFSLICGIYDTDIQIQQYYEKQVMLREVIIHAYMEM